LRDGPPNPEQLIGDIAAARAMTVADYMAAANAHYYATRESNFVWVWHGFQKSSGLDPKSIKDNFLHLLVERTYPLDLA